MFLIHANAPFSKNLQTAENDSIKFTRWYPKQPDTYLMLGYILMKRGKFAEAEKALSTVKKMLPNAPKSYPDEVWGFSAELNNLRLAYVQCCQRNDELALSYLHGKAHTRGEAFVDAPIMAHIFLGNLYSFAGIDEKADGFYRAARDKFDYGEWTRDQAALYLQSPGKRRIRFTKETGVRLQTWLNSHSEITPIE